MNNKGIHAISSPCLAMAHSQVDEWARSIIYSLLYMLTSRHKHLCKAPNNNKDVLLWGKHKMQRDAHKAAYICI